MFCGALGIHFFKLTSSETRIISKTFYSSVVKTSTISAVYSSKELGRVQIEGWITCIRKLKELIFIDISDGSCSKKLQVVITKQKVPKGLTYGTSVKAVGTLNTNKNNQLEVLVDDIGVLGECKLKEGYPFTQRMPYNPNHEREFIHLRPRTNTFSSLLRIRHKSQILLHNILDKEGFINVHVPVLTTNDCEGGGEVFTVKPNNDTLIKEMIKEQKNEKLKNAEEIFFDEKTFLTVSGQLHLEAAARALRKVYSFGPTFRAENSKSRLHLSEFYMLEAEIAFVNCISDVTLTVEILLKKLIEIMLSLHGEEIHSYLNMTNVNCDEHLENLNRIVVEKFITLSYDEAVNILNRNKDKLTNMPRNGESLSKEHELFLVEYCNQIPVFIVDWPAESKPFYMRSVSDGSNKVEAMDLLCMNVGELCGGSVREDNYEKLKNKIDKAKVGSKLNWYLQLREFGNVTTGGFGMGFERFLQLLLGTPNIKDTIPFPRWPHNCDL